MVLLLLIGAPFLISKITNRPVFTDSAFEKYLIQFESDAKKYNTHLNLYKLITIFSNKINTAETGAVAFCMPATKTVVISRPIWNKLDNSGKKALLYHEWGHCILRREHTESYDYSSLCPTSLMYPYIDPLKYCYNKHQESYNRELFTNPFNFKTFSRSKKK
jgi:hypothetical protein